MPRLGTWGPVANQEVPSFPPMGLAEPREFKNMKLWDLDVAALSIFLDI